MKKKQFFLNLNIKKLFLDKNKYFEKAKELIPDHVFVYCENIEKIVFDRFKYLQGLKFFYENIINNQKDIINFIKECKKFEDEKGYLNENYFLKFKKIEVYLPRDPLLIYFLQFKVKEKTILKLKLRIRL